jgi:hypothetical protein
MHFHHSSNVTASWSSPGHSRLSRAAVLAVFVLTDQVAVWHVFVLGGLLGVVSAFDITARQALSPTATDTYHARELKARPNQPRHSLNQYVWA